MEIAVQVINHDAHGGDPPQRIDQDKSVLLVDGRHTCQL
jgi:hypothetical protein